MPTEVPGVLENVKEQLEHELSDADRHDLKARSTVITAAAPAQAIATLAHDLRADLVVVGTRGRGGISHLLIGSVAEQLIRIVPCPILVVKHPEHEFSPLEAAKSDSCPQGLGSDRSIFAATA